MIQLTSEKKLRIKSEAAEWYAKSLAADFNAETRQDFQVWLESDQAHELAFEQCRALWSMTEALTLDDDIQNEIAAARKLAKDSRRRKGLTGLLNLFPGIYKGSAAVAFALILSVGIAYRFLPLTNEHYETSIGEQRVVHLADGSTITLNTATEVNVQFTTQKRRVNLLKGEAYFAVSKDRQRPFEVVTNTSLVRAVGTEFNVVAYSNSIAVDVAEGIVQLEAATESNPVAKVIAEIKYGEAIKYHRGEQSVAIQSANLARISAWKVNKIYFKGSTIAEAVAEYNRYIKEKIVVVDNELNDQQITGIFNLGDIDTFIFSLKQALNVRVERKQGLILVMKN